MYSYKKAYSEGIPAVMHTWMEDVLHGFDNE